MVSDSALLLIIGGPPAAAPEHLIQSLRGKLANPLGLKMDTYVLDENQFGEMVRIKKEYDVIAERGGREAAYRKARDIILQRSKIYAKEVKPRLEKSGLVIVKGGVLESLATLPSTYGPSMEEIWSMHLSAMGIPSMVVITNCRSPELAAFAEGHLPIGKEGEVREPAESKGKDIYQRYTEVARFLWEREKFPVLELKTQATDGPEAWSEAADKVIQRMKP